MTSHDVWPGPALKLPPAGRFCRAQAENRTTSTAFLHFRYSEHPAGITVWASRKSIDQSIHGLVLLEVLSVAVLIHEGAVPKLSTAGLAGRGRGRPDGPGGTGGGYPGAPGRASGGRLLCDVNGETALPALRAESSRRKVERRQWGFCTWRPSGGAGEGGDGVGEAALAEGRPAVLQERLAACGRGS